uniref:hypothetical protein n=1 Tax=Streptomyces kronopolitis TaxID=1612435 RepID=UPI0016670066|nr:hypothetical protein [Streptomyces kronopolitis]
MTIFVSDRRRVRDELPSVGPPLLSGSGFQSGRTALASAQPSAGTPLTVSASVKPAWALGVEPGGEVDRLPLADGAHGAHAAVFGAVLLLGPAVFVDVVHGVVQQLNGARVEVISHGC